MEPDFTQQAHDVFGGAAREAERWDDTEVAADHLLVALLRGQQTGATRLLTHFRIEVAPLLARLERYLSWADHGEQAAIRAEHARQADASVEILLPRTAQILDLAAAEAHRLGHPAVGTEHLLFGVLREGGSLGSWLLLREGLRPDTWSAELAVRLPEGPPVRWELPASEADLRAVNAVARLGLLGLFWGISSLMTLVSILEQRSDYSLWPVLLRSAWAAGIALGAVRPGMRLEHRVWPRMQALLFASSAGVAALLTAHFSGLAPNLSRIGPPLVFYTVAVFFTTTTLFRCRAQFGVDRREGWTTIWREGKIYLVVSAILELATLVSSVLPR